MPRKPTSREAIAIMAECGEPHQDSTGLIHMCSHCHPEVSITFGVTYYTETTYAKCKCLCHRRKEDVEAENLRALQDEQAFSRVEVANDGNGVA